MAKKVNENSDNTNHQSNDTNNTSNISTYSAVDTTKRESLPVSVSSSVTSTTPTTTSNVTTAQKPVVPKQDVNADTHNDFESRPKLATKATPAAVVDTAPRAVTDKNDNLSNELKLLQRENDALKIEVANLRVNFQMN